MEVAAGEERVGDLLAGLDDLELLAGRDRHRAGRRLRRRRPGCSRIGRRVTRQCRGAAPPIAPGGASGGKSPVIATCSRPRHGLSGHAARRRAPGPRPRGERPPAAGGRSGTRLDQSIEMKNGVLTAVLVTAEVITTVTWVLLGHWPNGPSTALATIGPLNVWTGVTCTLCGWLARPKMQ